ncbi:MAG: STAS domain-containing protein [SAR324 cluster bacterium]|nr:STAS domain-containing protein [SAR324 cluster bacterium]
MVITLKGSVLQHEVEHLKARLGDMVFGTTLSKIILNCEDLTSVDQDAQIFLKQWADEIVKRNVKITLIFNY